MEQHFQYQSYSNAKYLFTFSIKKIINLNETTISRTTEDSFHNIKPRRNHPQERN